jgi:hypothetical protein
VRNAPSLPPALSPDAAAWLRAHGAASVRVCADGIIEFSRRPLPDALTAAAVDALPGALPASSHVAALPLLQK